MLPLPGTIKLIELMGSDTVMYVDTQVTPASKPIEVVVFCPEVLTEYQIGQRIVLYFDPRDAFIFEKESGDFISKGEPVYS